MDWLIVGLGNPGPRYAHTRHNIGRDLVAQAADRWGIALDQTRHKALWGSGRRGQAQVCLALPSTYMNLSGEAVAPLMRFYKLEPSQVLAVYDELDLPLGSLRLRASGGAGGHNGMRSLIQHLGGQNFPRLRLGIGRPPGNWDPADYVLSRFSPDDQPEADLLIARGLDLLDDLLQLGLTTAMNRWNGAQGA